MSSRLVRRWLTVACACVPGLLGAACVENAGTSSSALSDEWSDPGSDSVPTVLVNSWRDGADWGLAPMRVDRVLDVIATACYDELKLDPVIGESCRAVGVTTRPGSPCKFDLCQQQWHLCIGYRAQEAAETLGGFEIETRPYVYLEATEEPQRPGYHEFPWAVLGGQAPPYDYSPEKFRLKIRLPPPAPAKKTLLLQAALEHFKQAVVASGQAIEGACVAAGGFDDVPPPTLPGEDLLPSERQMFIVSFQEATFRLDESLAATVDNEVGVSETAAALKGSPAVAQAIRWNAPSNSRLSAVTKLVGLQPTGQPVRDLGKCDVSIDREAIRIAVEMIRSARVSFWSDETAEQLALNVINAIRQDGDMPPLETTTAATNELRVAGTNLGDFDAARDYLLDERDAFARAAAETGETVATFVAGVPTDIPRYSGTEGTPRPLPATYLGGQLAGAMSRDPSDPLDEHFAATSVAGALTYAGDAAKHLLSTTSSLTDTETKMMRNLRGFTDAGAGDRRLQVSYAVEGPPEWGRYTVTATLRAPAPEGAAFVIARDDGDSGREGEGVRCLLDGAIGSHPCVRASYMVVEAAGVPDAESGPGWRVFTATATWQIGGRLLLGFLRDPHGDYELVQSFRAPATPGSAGTVLLVSHGTHEKMLGELVTRSPEQCFRPLYTCVGFRSDLVPPLENELTSDSDPYENAWRHYLQVASDAAAVADELGERVIEYGLANDLRGEAAEDTVRELCGDVGSADWSDLDGYAEGTSLQTDCTGESEANFDYVSVGGPLCLYGSMTEGPCNCPPGLSLCTKPCPVEAGTSPAIPADPAADAATCAEKYGFPRDPTLWPPGVYFAMTGAALEMFASDPTDEPTHGGLAPDCDKLRELRCRYEHKYESQGVAQTCSPTERVEYRVELDASDVDLRPLAQEVAQQSWFTLGEARKLAEAMVYREDMLFNWTFSRLSDPIWTTKVRTPAECPRERPFSYRNRSPELPSTPPADERYPAIDCVTPKRWEPAPLPTPEQQAAYLREDLIGRCLLGWDASSLPIYGHWTEALGCVAGEPSAEPRGRIRYLSGRRLLRTLYAMSFLTGGGFNAREAFRHHKDWYGTESGLLQGTTPFWLGDLTYSGLSGEGSGCGDGNCFCYSFCGWDGRNPNDDLFCGNELLPCIGADHTYLGDDPDCPNAWESYIYLWPGLSAGGGGAAGFTDCSYPWDGWPTSERAFVDTRSVTPDLASIPLYNQFIDAWWIEHAPDVLAQQPSPEGVGRGAYWSRLREFNASLAGKFRYALDDADSAKYFGAFVDDTELGDAQIGDHQPCGTAPGTDWFCTDRAEYVFLMPPTYDAFHVTPEAGYDALELLCYAAEGGGGCAEIQGDDPPDIESIEDIPAVKRWLACKTQAIASAVRKLALRDVPESVVNVVKSDTPTIGAHGSAQGKRMETLLMIDGALREMRDAVGRVVGVMDSMTNSLDTFYWDIKTQEAQAELDRLSMMESAILTVLNATSVSFDKMFEIGARADIAATAMVFLGLKMSALADRTSSAIAERSSQLYGELMSYTTQLDTEVSAVFKGYDDARAGLEEYRNLQAMASRDLARARLEVSDDADLVYRVNEVYRKRLNTAQKRYEKALQAARQLAFIARRAIEFRLGVDLSQMHDDLGLVPPPSAWYNDVCTMTGIDYGDISGRTRIAAGADAGADAAADTSLLPPEDQDYAASYVGDYVRRLQYFVEAYNVAYPFTDSTDTAVLSVRDDFLQTRSPCTRDSYNLLYRSGEFGVGDDASSTGWVVVGAHEVPVSGSCGDPDGNPIPCVAQATVEAVADDPYSECRIGDGDCSGALRLGATGALDTHAGLADLVRGSCRRVMGDGVPEHEFWMRSPMPPDPPAVDDFACPAGSFSAGYRQRLTGLVPGGRYLLTWYSARPKLRVAPTPEWYPIANYRTEVNDADSGTLVDVLHSSLEEDTTVLWHRVGFVFEIPPTASGDVDVVLYPSTDPNVPGGVWIRGMQLEPTTAPFGLPPEGAGAVARPYEEVGDSRLLTDAVCPDTSGEFMRRRFGYACLCRGDRDRVCTPDNPDADLDRCFYEIPFDVSLNQIESGELIPSSSIATGNFNYRHETIAINVVGTGVRGCDPGVSPETCYSNGFIPYSLLQDGRVGVRNHEWETLYFDMPAGRIENGKALAAEVVITNPPTSAHDALLGPYVKSELRGRPLHGGYVLRVWDTDELRWRAVEDIQLLVRYRYWTQFGGM